MPADPSVIATSVFGDDAATGYDGCNHLDFAYTVEGSSITFSDLVVTGRACDWLDEANPSQSLIDAMEATRRFELVGDQLDLLDASGAVTVRYRRAAPLPLSNVAWWLEGYSNDGGGLVSPLAEAPAHLTFGTHCRVSGSAGCNELLGEYRATGSGLELTSLTQTERACSGPSDLMEMEADFVAALRRVEGFSTGLTHLELLDDAGRSVASLRFGGRIR